MLLGESVWSSAHPIFFSGFPVSKSKKFMPMALKFHKLVGPVGGSICLCFCPTFCFPDTNSIKLSPIDLKFDRFVGHHIL